jgi:chromate transport protein ChrA
MARSLCPDRERATIAVLASTVTLAWPTAVGQLSSIAVAGIVGFIMFPGTVSSSLSHIRFPIGKKTAIAAWSIFFALLFGLPLLRQAQPSHTLEVFDSFFRVGSLVFGGGHVVLPLLQTEVVGPGWITNEQFVAGYGATQAVPGPLFTFSAYLGAVMGPEPNGWTGAFLALVAIFLPSFLLVVGTLPFWDTLRSAPVFQSALKGIAADSTLHTCLDQRDLLTRGLRPWTRCFRTLDVLEISPLAGGWADRRWRGSHRAHIAQRRDVMSIIPVHQRGYANPQLLAETDWLAKHMDDPAVRIVDARLPQQCVAGHIPGAVNLPGTNGIPRTVDVEQAHVLMPVVEKCPSYQPHVLVRVIVDNDCAAVADAELPSD